MLGFWVKLWEIAPLRPALTSPLLPFIVKALQGAHLTIIDHILDDSKKKSENYEGWRCNT